MAMVRRRLHWEPAIVSSSPVSPSVRLSLSKLLRSRAQVCFTESTKVHLPTLDVKGPHCMFDPIMMVEANVAEFPRCFAGAKFAIPTTIGVWLEAEIQHEQTNVIGGRVYGLNPSMVFTRRMMCLLTFSAATFVSGNPAHS